MFSCLDKSCSIPILENSEKIFFLKVSFSVLVSVKQPRGFYDSPRSTKGIVRRSRAWRGPTYPLQPAGEESLDDYR